MDDFNSKRTGLRVHEIEACLAANIDPYSAELVEYVNTREVGRAARLAMLIRGMDIIESKTYLARIAASALKIDPTSFESVLRTMMDAGLLRDGVVGGKRVLVEQVAQVDFSSNYTTLGELWIDRNPTPKEIASVKLLDTLIEMPTVLEEIPELNELNRKDRNRVIELALNACYIDAIEYGYDGRRVFYSPILWDIDPKKVQKFLKLHGQTGLSQVISMVGGQQGTFINPHLKNPLINEAISAGVLPSHTIRSLGGERTYSFAPYTGRIATSAEEREILHRSRSIVACLKYGSEAAVITKIRDKRVVLNALLDSSRDFRIGPHTEIKDQYGILVTKGIGKVLRSGSKYYFKLIPSKENIRAGNLAVDFISGRGSPPESALDLPNGARVLSMSGEMTNPEKEIQIAKAKRKATSDELAELVESIRTTD